MRLNLKVGKKYRTMGGHVATVIDGPDYGGHFDVKVRRAHRKPVSAGPDYGVSDSWYYTKTGKFVCEEKNPDFKMHLLWEIKQ